jgi:hypothetical protein
MAAMFVLLMNFNWKNIKETAYTVDFTPNTLESISSSKTFEGANTNI